MAEQQQQQRQTRMRSASEIIIHEGRASIQIAHEQVTLTHIPEEILLQIISKLDFPGNIKAAAVCSRWRKVALSVRKANTTPLLMYNPRKSDAYEFYDPYQRILHRLINLPKWSELCVVCYVKDSWLLLLMLDIGRMMLFCPYTKELVDLPAVHMPYLGAAFSAPPNSPDCIVFSITFVGTMNVDISTCRPGDNEWTTTTFVHDFPFSGSHWQRVAFRNGLFYIFGNNGWIGVFDPAEHTWDVLGAQPPSCLSNVVMENYQRKFFAEHNGDLYLVCTNNITRPIVYKLDDNIWREVNDLGGATFFASSRASSIRTDMTGVMRNSIYFAMVEYSYGLHCVVYSLDEKRFYPRLNEGIDTTKLNHFASFWIDAPKDFSIFR